MSRPSEVYRERRPRLWLGPLLVVGVWLVFPAVEIVVLVLLGRQIGALPTIGVVLATSVVGALVLGREVPRRWRSLRAALTRERLEKGELPGRELADGALVLLGGVLLLLPGLVSDVLGLVCLLPFTRPLARLGFGVWISRRAAAAAHRVRRSPRLRTRGAVVSGEVVEPGADGSGRPTTPGPTGPRVVEGTVLPPPQEHP